MPENKFKIGITQGDTNGIGWEIILKALADPRMTELFTPVVYGSPKAAAYYRNTVAEIEAFSFNPVASAAEARRGKANLVACGETADIAPGKPTPEAGRAAVEALCAAMRDLKAGHLDALVTAPFDKETVQADDFRYTGHTEYLAAELEGEAMMILCSDVLRVGLVTKHIPVSEIARNITKERIVRDLGTLRRALIEDFGIVEPRIAVMALNPHAGDGGLLGREEQEVIIPAIKELSDNGIRAFGPYAADGFFGHESYTAFDGVLAMYHDQGLAPFKCLDLGNGVNFTAGLPIVRTSPDHGTAYDIAGKNMADENSFRNAIYLALDVFRNRIEYDEPFNNPLKKLYHEKRDDSEKARFSINKFKEQDNSGDDKNAKEE